MTRSEALAMLARENILVEDLSLVAGYAECLFLTQHALKDDDLINVPSGALRALATVLNDTADFIEGKGEPRTWEIWSWYDGGALILADNKADIEKCKHWRAGAARVSSFEATMEEAAKRYREWEATR